MIELTVTLGRTEYGDVLGAMTSLARDIVNAPNAASKPLHSDMRIALQLVANKMRRIHSSAWNGTVKSSNPNLQKRSGDGLRSIENSIRVTGNASGIANVIGRISTGKMGVHETGAVIRATKSKYLTIPLPAAMDSRGVSLRRRARDWPNTFVKRSRRGNLIIFQKRGRDTIVPLYLLKPEVTIPPRLKMKEAVINDAMPYYQGQIMDRVEAAILEEFARGR